ncbi:unnamed protein product [Anisakis simplex]|uniref:Uncharacterized protein n=1 Tax=Anisakis simplex TaxID=6269 RepID=A0A0M3KKF2_ANISI|nr:unnamed protein product [Anisakis simplex]
MCAACGMPTSDETTTISSFHSDESDSPPTNDYAEEYERAQKANSNVKKWKDLA